LDRPAAGHFADTGAAVEDLADDVSVNGDGPDIDGTDVEETEED